MIVGIGVDVVDIERFGRQLERTPGLRDRLFATIKPDEAMIETVRRIARNVKRWQSGDMCLRWTAAGMLEAETQFRRVIGHGDLAKLAVIVERDVIARRTAHPTTTQADTLASA